MNFRDGGDNVFQLFDLFDYEARLREKIFENAVPLETTNQLNPQLLPRRLVFFICYSSLNKSNSSQLYFNVGILLQELCTLNSESMKKEIIKNEIH